MRVDPSLDWDYATGLAAVHRAVSADFAHRRTKTARFEMLETECRVIEEKGTAVEADSVAGWATDRLDKRATANEAAEMEETVSAFASAGIVL